MENDQTPPAAPLSMGTLAAALEGHPTAAAALQASLDRQAARRAPAGPTAASLTCPHCGAPAVPVVTLPGPDGPRTFCRRPLDCCQRAMTDAALDALRYSMGPLNDKQERRERAALFVALRAQITDPDLGELLDAATADAAGILARVTRSGGYATGARPQALEAPARNIPLDPTAYTPARVQDDG